MLGLGHVTLRTVENPRKCAVLALEAASSRRSPDALVHVPDAPDAPDTLASGTSAKIRGSAVLMVPDSRQKRRCCCGAAVAEQPERDSSATAAPVAAIAPARSASPRIDVHPRRASGARH
jgi:hypothetical protein